MLRLLKVIYVTNQALICQPSLFISVTAGHQCCGLWGVDICCFVILIAISRCVWVIRDGGTGPWQYGHLSEWVRERMRERDSYIAWLFIILHWYTTVWELILYLSHFCITGFTKQNCKKLLFSNKWSEQHFPYLPSVGQTVNARH